MSLPNERARRALLLSFALLSAASSCELLIGIPDVTRDTTGAGGGEPECELSGCEGAECDPVQFASVAELGAEPGETGVQVAALSVHDGVAYWGVELPGTKMLVAKPVAGGDAQILSQGNGNYSRFAADEEHVYWTSPYVACAFRVPRKGGQSEELVPCGQTGSGISPAVVVNESHVFWVVAEIKAEDCQLFPGCCDGESRSCVVASAKGSGSPAVLLGGRANITDLAESGGEVFFIAADLAGSTTIEVCPKSAAACEPVVFVEASGGAESPRRVAAGGGYLYWSNNVGEIRRKLVSAQDTSAGEVVQRGQYLQYLFADQLSVFLSTSVQELFEVRHDAPGELLPLGGAAPYHVATDCEHIYFTEDAGTVSRRPR